MDHLAEHRKILALAVAGELPDRIDAASDVAVNIVKELCDAGMLDAIDASSMDGEEFLEPKITMRGRIYLSELDGNQSAQRNTRTDIRSHDQYGGITANTVNIHQPPTGTAAGERKRNWWAILGSVLAAAAAVVAILGFVGVGPFKLFTSSEQRSNTPAAIASTVAREMTDSQGESIKRQIPTGSKVTVGAILEDPEAIEFANQVRDWLLIHGYPNIEPVATVGGLPNGARGIVTRQTETGVLVFVGARVDGE